MFNIAQVKTQPVAADFDSVEGLAAQKFRPHRRPYLPKARTKRLIGCKHSKYSAAMRVDTVAEFGIKAAVNADKPGTSCRGTEGKFLGLFAIQLDGGYGDNTVFKAQPSA